MRIFAQDAMIERKGFLIEADEEQCDFFHNPNSIAISSFVKRFFLI